MLMQDLGNSRKIAGRIVVIAILLVVFVAGALSAWYFLYTQSTGPVTGITEVAVTIPKGVSVTAIQEILVQQKVIHDDVRFQLLARLSGYSGRLQAGEFLLPTGQKPLRILELLASSRSIQYPVTIPEGLSYAEIAEIFAGKGWCNAEKFKDLSQNIEFIESLGMEGVTNLEGYLFPDTYLLTKNSRGAEQIIAFMVSRFKEVWGELTSDKQPLPDRNKTVTLASIVEKETGAAVERGLIAGVFHNRLRLGMRLQSDPTVVYGVKDFSGKITKKHLKSLTPYNTYMIPALPVGPICNPGRDAMRAVLEPEQTKNLYFVSKNDGSHKFSATLREHNRAVRKYQRKSKANKANKGNKGR